MLEGCDVWAASVGMYDDPLERQCSGLLGLHIGIGWMGVALAPFESEGRNIMQLYKEEDLYEVLSAYEFQVSCDAYIVQFFF